MCPVSKELVAIFGPINQINNLNERGAKPVQEEQAVLYRHIQACGPS